MIPTTTKKMKLDFEVFLSFIINKRSNKTTPKPKETRSGTLINESIEFKIISCVRALALGVLLKTVKKNAKAFFRLSSFFKGAGARCFIENCLVVQESNFFLNLNISRLSGYR